jgi:hypothetical protein
VIFQCDIHDMAGNDGAIVLAGTLGIFSNHIEQCQIYDVAAGNGIVLGSADGSDTPQNADFVHGNSIYRLGGDAIVVNRKQVWIEGNEIFGCTGENGGIYIRVADYELWIRRNSIHDNNFSTSKWPDSAGIFFGPQCDLSLFDHTLSGGNNLYNNTPNGMSNKAPLLLVGEGHWWGDPSGPSGAGGGSGDAVSGNVDFEPWLDQPAELPTYGPIPCGPVPVQVIPSTWGHIKSSYR